MLLRKLIREIYAQKWQYGAVALMLALGVAFYISATLAYQNLHTSYERSYQALAFEDMGMKINHAPARAAERLLRIPGVLRTQGRLQEDFSVEIPGHRSKRLVGRLISTPAPHRPSVNLYRVIAGADLAYSAAREILLESKFAEHHGLRPGDEIIVHRLGDRARFRIAGIVKSPEYIYVVKSKQDLLPMPDTFGVMFVSESVLGNLVGKTGIINEIRWTVAPNANRERIKRDAMRALSEYRPDEPIEREEQPSHQLLQQDLEGFRVYAVLFPAFFLTVAAVIVYTLLSRMVAAQRTFIALLRALGATRREVTGHYLLTAVFVGTIASAAGALLGLWMAKGLTDLYLSFIAVPYAHYVKSTSVILQGAAIGLIACLIASWAPARAASRILPAEGMRPAPPQSMKASWADRIIGGLPLLARIPLRNLYRQPKRSLSSIFGIVAGIALIMTGRGLMDSMDSSIDMIVTGSFKEDLRVGFLRHGASRDVSAIQSIPGVIRAEGALEIPVWYERNGKRYESILVGVDPGSMMTQLKDEQDRPIRIGADDLALGPTLRKKMQVERGDMLHLTLPESEATESPASVMAKVTLFNWEPIGTVGYTSRRRAESMFGQELNLPPSAVTSVRMMVDPRYEQSIRKRLETMPDVGAVFATSEMRRMVDELTATSRTFVLIMLLFGAALSFSVVFNVFTVNVMERSQEIATMRAIGLTKFEAVRMIATENLLLAAAGILIGLPVGRVFVEQFIAAAQTEEQTELFSIRLSIAPETYVLTAAIILIVSVLSQAPAMKSALSLDLSKAVKERSG